MDKRKPEFLYNKIEIKVNFHDNDQRDISKLKRLRAWLKKEGLDEQTIENSDAMYG